MPIKQINYILQVLLLVSILSCDTKEKQKEIIVAEVGSSKLTEKQLNRIFKIDSRSSESQEEIIRNWTETELLYQAAMENNLLDENNFYKIIEQSEKKLAASYVILDYLKRNKMEIRKEDLVKYFLANKENYRLPTDAYILNYICFTNEKDAIKFRSVTLLKNWQFAKEKNENKKNVLKEYIDKLVKVSDIQSKKLLRVLKELRRNETSIVIETELSNFVVVQLVNKLNKNDIPKLKYVKESVKITYAAQMNKKMVSNFINKLIMQKDVKLN